MRAPRVTSTFARWCVFALAVGCGGEAEGGPCINATSCGPSQACIDGLCVPRSDASAPVPEDAAPYCEIVESALERTAPIDVVLVVDRVNATSEIASSIREAVSGTLVPALERGSIDYRIVLMSSCELDLEGIPAERYVRYPLILRSDDDLEVLLQNYEERTSRDFADLLEVRRCLENDDDFVLGWRSALRPGARKAFVHFVDPNEEREGYPREGTFDEALRELDPETFASAGEPSFVYHAFVGALPPPSPAALHCASDEIARESCSSRRRSQGTLYQEIAQRTGGSRGSLCDTTRLVEGVGALSERVVAFASECTFPLPESGADRLTLRWTTTTAVRDLARVGDATSCTGDGFYVEGTTIGLCPASCRIVRGSGCERDGRSGALSARVGCEL